MRFPYQRYAVAGIGSHLTTVWRPALLVRVIGPTGDDAVFGRVDTGADDALLPDFLIAPLGVALDPGAVAILEGLDGGTVLVRYGAVDLELADATSSFRWNALVGFYTISPYPVLEFQDGAGLEMERTAQARSSIELYDEAPARL